jgi:hypothetical protein
MNHLRECPGARVVHPVDDLEAGPQRRQKRHTGRVRRR